MMARNLDARLREVKKIDLPQQEPEHSAAVAQAAHWLADQHEALGHVIRTLSDMFKITAAQAAQACTLANQDRVDRRPRG